MADEIVNVTVTADVVEVVEVTVTPAVVEVVEIDFSSEVEGGVSYSQEEEPVDPLTGETWFVPSTGKIFVRDISGWVSTTQGMLEASATLTKLEGPMTRATYDAIVTPSSDTLYVIVG